MHLYDFNNQIIDKDEIADISNMLKETDFVEYNFLQQNQHQTNKFRDKKLAQKIAKLDEVLAKIG